MDYSGQPTSKNAPADQRLDLLLEQVQSLQKLIENSSTNPLRDPLASLTATVEVTLTVDQPKPTSNYDGSGAWIAFGRGSSALAAASTLISEYIKTGPTSVRFRFNVNVAADSDMMGKPITELKRAEYIQIMLPTDLVPQGTAITSGRITWVANNRITLRFLIPPQSTTGRIGTADSDKSFAFVRALNEGFSPLGP